MNTRLNIAILYGGKSVEHEISIRSAKNVVAHIDQSKYAIQLIGIDKQGVWYLSKSVEDNIDKGSAVSIKLDTSSPFLIDSVSGKEIIIDVIFPVLHGTDGEDGSIQGLFKVLDLPVVGSGVLGSAISMDKIISKKVLKEGGIPVAPYIEFQKSQIKDISYAKVSKSVGVPFMIKSAALGSSVGISMVKSEEDFLIALADSFQYGDKIIVESFVKGRELECAILGNETPQASVPGEIVMVKEYDFYTYEAKYLDENAIEIQIPAKADEAVLEHIRKICIQAYKALRCDDYARVDLFLTEEGDIIINEINTIPGFTDASMFPMMWKHMGIGFTDLITRIIELCVKRHKDSKNLETSYNRGN